MLPTSPEKTIFFSMPPSCSQNSMQAEPSRCPMSENRTRIPSAIGTIWPYRQGRKSEAAPFASSTVYSGTTGGSPARSALRVFQAASDSWMLAESRSMTSASAQVAGVA